MTTKNLSAFVTLVLSLLVIVTGCQGKKADRSDTTLVTAFKLIDEQRDDEAIFLLEAEVNRNPDPTPYRMQVQMALASAYAHKAGIKVQKFGPLIEVGKNKIHFDSNLALRNASNMSKTDSVDQLVHGLAGMFGSFRLVMDYYTAVPSVTTDNEQYLEYSVRILNSLGAKLTQGQAAYRAIINVIYLKNYLAVHVFDDGMVVDLDVKSCEIDFIKIDASLKRTAKIGIQIFDDLSVSLPAKSKDFQRLREQLVRSVPDLTAVMTSVSLVDETTTMFAKNAIVESGLRNLLKCRSSKGSDSAVH